MQRSTHLTGRASGLSEGPKLGDVDGDGTINATDALLAARHAEGKETLPPEKRERADVDGDGEVTQNDADLIQRYYIGKIDQFPADQNSNGGGGNGGNGGNGGGSSGGGSNGEGSSSTSKNGQQAGMSTSTVLLGVGAIAAVGIGTVALSE